MTTDLLKAEGLSNAYVDPAGGPDVKAIQDISLTVEAGRNLGILGASGAGKSTLMRILLGLESPDQGRVIFDGIDIHQPASKRSTPIRGRIQVVFQDPRNSLNPHLSVATIVAEPLLAQRRTGRQHQKQLVLEMLDLVGIRPEMAERRPDALSGGERQRVAIARALITHPDVVILDEPVSALDAPVRLQVLDLLGDLQERLNLTIILVSHDVRTIAALADYVMVLLKGRCVEEGSARELLEHPRHPYTRALLAAVPTLKARGPDGMSDRLDG
ncbi:MAG: ATP-binding cassette domain-containing protein [Thermoanaerobaculales bacterium]|nr:ATP-binding cassette domain-containing protein [Thermoanaerobaculales bacterium]